MCNFANGKKGFAEEFFAGTFLGIMEKKNAKIRTRKHISHE